MIIVWLHLYGFIKFGPEENICETSILCLLNLPYMHDCVCHKYETNQIKHN